MILPPAVCIHSLAMAKQALAPGLPVTLLSAPGAGVYAGVGWWRSVIRLAAPPSGTPDILDCGDAAGRALEALRGGQKLLLLQARPDVRADVAERAIQSGAVVLPRRPPCLDLAERGAARRLQDWLRGK